MNKYKTYYRITIYSNDKPPICKKNISPSIFEDHLQFTVVSRRTIKKLLATEKTGKSALKFQPLLKSICYLKIYA
jgi:hypothetical protein